MTSMNENAAALEAARNELMKRIKQGNETGTVVAELTNALVNVISLLRNIASAS